MAKPSLLIITHLFAAGAGFIVAPREEPLESEVKHEGFFHVDTKRVLAAAVESLRTENSLVVYAYKGFAAVSVEKDGFLLLDGRQDLLVPASVTYMVPLSGLTADNLTIDYDRNTLTVRVPNLIMSDVAFEPEGARILNAGIITFSEEQVQAFTRQNYASARRAFIKQAQGSELIRLAEQQASKNIERYLEAVLRAGGPPDIQVLIRFEA
ncbi:DUF4230 domain-containing protein [Sphingomonas glaciei]|uniref:DUF4230 domain-containing protein n=1 Tax=Sphingomonas glaciei TaxID=2938948 RepID=A0ABY5MU13_9SPHN|nr:DUF4230 domain-containing protein [Sphingomonas glaciei]UUR07582.1 DUF4230 domain-containing protein [Sphingomonas glaciei]